MEIVVSSEGALVLAGPEDFRSFRVVVPKAVAPSVTGGGGLNLGLGFGSASQPFDDA